MADTKQEDMPISKGLVYKNKESGEEVVPFLVEMSGLVVYAPVGSAREVRVQSQEFRDMFELDQEALKGQEAAQADAEARSKSEPADSFATADGKRIPTGDGTTTDGEVAKRKAAVPETTDRTNDALRANPDLAEADTNKKGAK